MYLDGIMVTPVNVCGFCHEPAARKYRVLESTTELSNLPRARSVHTYRYVENDNKKKSWKL